MRYLLHLTAKSNLSHILKNGLKAVRTPSNHDPMTGVFMVSANDLKYWNNVALDTGFTKRRGILDCLIEQVSKGTDEIVALRIPLSKLKSPIKIRDISISLGDRAAVDRLVTRDELLQLEKLYGRNSKRFIFEKGSLAIDKQSAHCSEGVSFSQVKSLQGKKKAIEYIYPSDIPPDAIEYVGKANITNKTNKEVFSELFNGQPEQHSLMTWG